MLGSVGNKAMEAKAREVAAQFAGNVNREVDVFSGDKPDALSSPQAAAPSKPSGWERQIVGLVRTVVAWLFAVAAPLVRRCR
jgi:hypothetical protein